MGRRLPWLHVDSGIRVMGTKQNDNRSSLPKMDLLLALPEILPLMERFGRQQVRATARAVLDQLREIIARQQQPDLSLPAITKMIGQRLQKESESGLKKVINASGVVIHTNLGRSPLPDAARERLLQTAWGYSNLEFDLQRGERGERYSHVDDLICELTGAEAALVVNNNAAAVLLCLTALAAQREVIVSRGELVEIGGSFRIPEVMRQGGAMLVEVGTTNRTHARDYSQAITEQTAMLMKVHTSNFAQVGFTAETDVEELAGIAHGAGLLLYVDAGSGCLLDLEQYGIAGEATIQSYLKRGADLVSFSGDKLLGGPQAGIIAGRQGLINQLKKHQLLRALRIDKLTLAALQETLLLYRDPQKLLATVPTLRMLTISLAEIEQKAERIMQELRKLLPDQIELKLQDGNSAPGGGSLPLIQLPTRLIELHIPSVTASRLEVLLRNTSPPVVGRIRNDCFLLDVRTLAEAETPLLAAAIKQALEAANG